jgi:hypothetical protein
MLEKGKVLKIKEVRDLSIRKICEVCGIPYHPRKNGYQTTSRFCSAECTRKARKQKKLIW